MTQINEMVAIPKDEYLRLKALEKDLSDLKSVSEVWTCRVFVPLQVLV